MTHLLYGNRLDAHLCLLVTMPFNYGYNPVAVHDRIQSDLGVIPFGIIEEHNIGFVARITEDQKEAAFRSVVDIQLAFPFTTAVVAYCYLVNPLPPLK